jgi:hypothetical protein
MIPNREIMQIESRTRRWCMGFWLVGQIAPYVTNHRSISRYRRKGWRRVLCWPLIEDEWPRSLAQGWCSTSGYYERMLNGNYCLQTLERLQRSLLHSWYKIESSSELIILSCQHVPPFAIGCDRADDCPWQCRLFLQVFRTSHIYYTKWLISMSYSQDILNLVSGKYETYWHSLLRQLPH